MKVGLHRVLPIAALLTVSLASPAAAAVIDGTNGPDVLVGTTKADTIRGYGGRDTIYGKAGADVISAGRDSKRDHLYGGPGNDKIHVWLGDTANAGRGNDVVRLHNGARWAMTRIFCGPGHDRFYTGMGGSGADEPDNGSGWLITYRSCEEVY